MTGTRGISAVLAVAALLAVPSGALAQSEPPAQKSASVTWKDSLPEPSVVSARFSSDKKRMYVSTLKGLAVYDITTAATPRRIGFLPLPHFENEDVDMSIGKNFVLISNDPSEGKGVLFVVSVANPAAPVLIGQMDTGYVGAADFAPFLGGEGPFSYGTGHTASCVPGPLDDCQFAYLAGTSAGIDVVDLTIPSAPHYATPRNLAVPEATGGLATHDVQFDRAGHALIVGAGGTAIYNVANPLKPVLLSHTDPSGKSDLGEDFGADGSTLNDLIHHNSHRLPNSSLAGYSGPLPEADSNYMVVTEEDYQRPGCAGAGSVETWRIDGAIMHNVGRWDVEAGNTVLCSAHYFDENAGLITQGWYEQGTRFLDVSNPAKIRQVGYWIPAKNVTWSSYFHPVDHNVVYSLDHPRGIDVLRIKRGGPTVVAPYNKGGAGSLCTIRPRTNGKKCKGAKLRVRVRGGRRVKAGKRAYFRVSVRNVGETIATGVKVRLKLPKALRHVRGGKRRKHSRTVVFSLGRLKPGQVKSKRLVTRARRGTKGTKLKLRARATIGGASATAAMPSVTAPVAKGGPRQRFRQAYGLCRIVIG